MITFTDAWSLFRYLAVQGLGVMLALVAVVIVLYLIVRTHHSVRHKLLIGAIVAGLMLFWFPTRIPMSFQYPIFLKTFGPADSPALPLKNVLAFLSKGSSVERVSDIARDPGDVPSPITRLEPERVRVVLESKEVIAEMAPGISFNYWTFNGTVPGPFIRVREGDTVELTLSNHPSSINHHNIDLHAVTGPGGGAVLTNVAPGESKSMTFKAINPGLYVYHCAHPNVATHTTHGMYGLILVEPKEGLPKVDREYYIMQGEFYSTGALGKKGLQIFDARKMLEGKPEYIVFNGKTQSLAETLKATTGESVRLFIGNGGVNLVSSFHVIGEIFDTVYPEASIGGAVFKNVQTTVIPAGGAAIADFKLEVPGNYILVDHALSRLDRGAWGVLNVAGVGNPEVLEGHSEGMPHGH